MLLGQKYHILFPLEAEQKWVKMTFLSLENPYNSNSAKSLSGRNSVFLDLNRHACVYPCISEALYTLMHFKP